MPLTPGQAGSEESKGSSAAPTPISEEADDKVQGCTLSLPSQPFFFLKSF
jgi:hypothetical protein